MRKSRTSHHAVAVQVAAEKRQIKDLRDQRRRLASQLAKIDSKLEKAIPKKPQSLSVAELDRLLDKLADSNPAAPPLPADFSRADLYYDHD